MRGHPPAALTQDPGTRRIGEVLMPAAVILAGVLVVVAFAFIVNRAMNGDSHDQAIPPPQPPALGGVQLAPTANQGVIPLASPSPSRTTPAPSAPATTTRPPSRQAPPPDNGAVAVRRAGVPPLVDLSGEGRVDWVHWGEQSTFSLERAKDGDFRILEGAPTAPRFRHGLSPQLFSWQDGSPVDHSDGTPTGVRTCGKGNGFTLSAPASRTQRTLRLYVGALAAEGRLEARLSTGGGTATGTLEQRANSLATAVFVITYRAPRDGTLKLSWNTRDSFNTDCGGVALEAATLR